MNDDDATRLLGAAATTIPPIPPPSTAQLITGGKRIQRRQRLLSLGGAAAAAALVLGAGSLWLPALNGEDNAPLTSQRSTNPTSASGDTRLVGIGRVVVAVPASWGFGKAVCNSPYADTVFFPSPADCISGAQVFVSSLAIARVGWREVGYSAESMHSGARVQGLRVRESSLYCNHNLCSQSVAIPSRHAYFEIQVAGSGSRATATAIRQSLQILPGDYTTVPFDSTSSLSGSADQVAAFLRAHGLDVTTTTVDAAEKEPGDIISITPEPGSVIPTDGHVVITVASK